MRILRKLLLSLGVLCVILAVIFFAFREPDISRAALIAAYKTDASQFIELPSGAVAHIYDQGKSDGFPLILIHGFSDSLHAWEAWIAPLGDTYRLIRIDLPAHGLTGTVPNGDYSIKAMAAFVKEIADHLKLDQFALAGNSMGGNVSLQFALDYPQSVAALIPISSSGLARDPEDEAVGAFQFLQNPIGRFLMRHITPRKMVENTVRQVVAEPDNFVTKKRIDRYWHFLLMEETRAARLKITREDLDDQLAAINTPTLILWGAQDMLTRPKYAPRLQRKIKASQLVIYENAGHLAMSEIPLQTAADVRQFLNRIGK